MYEVIVRLGTDSITLRDLSGDTTVASVLSNPRVAGGLEITDPLQYRVLAYGVEQSPTQILSAVSDEGANELEFIVEQRACTKA